MEARTLSRPGRALIPGLLVALLATPAAAQELRVTPNGVVSRNFIVQADNPETAKKVALAAEEYRRELAIFWLGEPLPNWSRPCRLRVREGALGAAGQTTFQFVRGEVVNWNMFVQGSLERILDSVLPHEVNHTIFACHFRRPLPRWADEGAATLFEHQSEQAKQLALLKQVMTQGRENFSLRQLLNMKEYPEGMRPMLILYSQGYALADFLVQQKGRQTYLAFLADGERIGWERAIRQHFDHEGIESLETNWKGWVLAGMPKLTLPEGQMIAATTAGQSTARPDLQLVGGPAAPIVRSQSPDSEVSDNTRFAEAAVSDDAQSRSESPAAAADPSSWLPHAGLRSRETREGSGADAFRRTPTQPRGARHQTIQAPLPQHRGRARSSSATTGDSLNTGHTTPPESSLDAGFIRSSSAGDRERLQPTTSSSPRASGREHSFDPFSTSTSSSPRERKAVSGTVPQWAGFPGQAKSF